MTERLGVEGARFEGATRGSVVRQWDLEGFFLTVEADKIGSITELTVAIGSEAPDLRISLLEGLVLGEAIMGNVVEALGSPSDTDVITGEDVWIHSYIYRLGPEGTHVHEFSHAEDGEDIGFGPQLDASLVTAFSIHFPRS